MTNILTFALLAQSNLFGGLIATAKGLLAVVVAGLLSIAVAWGTAVLVWRLLVAMVKDPKLEKLVGLVVTMVAAVALIGATPGFIGSAYTWGQGIGTGAGVAPADATAGAGQ